jgi:hypothetical protein
MNIKRQKINDLLKDQPGTSQTGRFTVYSTILDRTFVIEPIEDHPDSVRTDWGDINPATKSMEGSYGNKNKGSIKDKESIITKENGFDKIQYLRVGESPLGYIEQLEREYLAKQKNEEENK